MSPLPGDHPADLMALKRVAPPTPSARKLVAEPIAIVGVSTILEDQAGGLVRLNLFNCLPGGATGPAAQDLAQRTFPRGTRISIAEPFLKIMLDGTRVVRIDDPSDVRVQVDVGCVSWGSAAQRRPGVGSVFFC